MGYQTMEVMGDAQAHEAITPGNTATGITDSLLRNSDKQSAVAAFVTVEDNTVNYTIHGTAPTAAAGTNVGHAAPDGSVILLKGIDELTDFSCIDRVSGSAGVVKVTIFY